MSSSMSLRLFCAAVCFLVLAGSAAAAGNSEKVFLGGQRRSPTRDDFKEAMGTVMGCGGGVAQERLLAVEAALEPMWRVLPKNEHELVEWRMMRYLAHRYFMQQSSLLVRGFEPMRQINASDLGAPDIFTGSRVASTLQDALDSASSAKGFSLHDAAAMVLTLEQLISDAEGSLLEKAYRQQRRSPKDRVGLEGLSEIMEAYLVHWMIGDDDQVVNIVMANRSLMEEVLPKWHDLKAFVDGEAKSIAFQRQSAPKKGHAQAALAGQFSFQEAHEAVGGFTKRFASFWENECQTIKASLVALDKTGTGRVRLSDFYGANADGDWRFGESEAYLRELGALDESSPWQGKQVIIPNYLQGASNCIVTTPHYLVCCVSECEAVLNEIEAVVGDPVADPDMILSVVGNMSGLDDQPPSINALLRKQLLRIAEIHSGAVPLHGRLFAQWLHYVFPHECPFPHKAGAAAAMTPSQFGESFIASSDEVSGHAATRNNHSSAALGDLEEVQLMSQWSEEEELIADYSSQLRAPWEGNYGAFLGVAILVLALAAAAGLVTLSKETSPSKPAASRWAFEQKAHFV